MPHMIATKDFTYAGGALQLKTGDRFFALSERDAKWLKVWGKAERTPAGAFENLRRDEMAQVDGCLGFDGRVGINGIDLGPPKRPRGRPRKYDRRDMTADK